MAVEASQNSENNEFRLNKQKYPCKKSLCLKALTRDEEIIKTYGDFSVTAESINGKVTTNSTVSVDNYNDEENIYATEKTEVEAWLIQQ
jgi:hypothetical protein